jgi:hypothetical protein
MARTGRRHAARARGSGGAQRSRLAAALRQPCGGGAAAEQPAAAAPLLLPASARRSRGGGAAAPPRTTTAERIRLWLSYNNTRAFLCPTRSTDDVAVEHSGDAKDASRVACARLPVSSCTPVTHAHSASDTCDTMLRKQPARTTRMRTTL